MKKEWLKIEIPNLQFKPWIDSLLSTCDNKPPARTFSHNYVPQKVNLAHSYWVFFCFLLIKCHSVWYHTLCDISLLQMYDSNLNYCNVQWNIEKRNPAKNLAAQTNCWYYRYHWHKCQFSLCHSVTQSQFV